MEGSNANYSYYSLVAICAVVVVEQQLTDKAHVVPCPVHVR